MLYAVRIATGADFAPLVEAGLELAGVEMISSHQVDTGTTCFEAYRESQADAACLAAELEEHLQGWAEGERWAVTVDALPDSAWRDAWKHFFRTEQVSPNVVVRPPWEPAVSQARCVVEINPGLSFGTGRHFTTRSCLQVLDQFGGERPGAAVLDVGCGSGILAIAAVKLGYTRVTAFDNDPQAVTVAAENAAINGVADRLALSVGDVATYRALAPFDIVVANLFDELLRAHAVALTGFLKPVSGSRLVLAGMLGAQFAAVKAVYASCGWVPENVMQDVEWTTAVMRPGPRPAGASR
ncbi:MAG: 50S ribosomal protein L11 methyltransferase [Lentisphaerae bacterium]|nr:50S ribosomal protein L11 methyltransferase [Lentisphaerota bacterium]